MSFIFPTLLHFWLLSWPTALTVEGPSPSGSISTEQTLSDPVVMKPSRVLRKLSQKLRGSDPSAEEYQDLQKAVAVGDAAVEKVLLNMTNVYLKSPEFVEVMMDRALELFRLPGSHMDPSLQNDPDYQSIHLNMIENSSVWLIREIFRENLSWNRLLLQKNYQAYDRFNSLGYEDAFFFGPILNGSTGKVPGPIKFKENDQRIAGILTSTLFFTRYNAAAANVNRRLGAAVRRIFLCDDLQAAVDLTMEERAKQDRGRLETLIKLFAEAPAELDDDPHSTQPACVACHEKIDPIASTFGTPGRTAMDKLASPGALVVFREGKKVSIPVKGIAELGKVIVNSEEYQSCQVDRFWNWFVGPEVALKSESKKLLQTSFNTKGVQSFIADVVAQPEFRFDRARLITEPPPSTFEPVKPLFEKCNACHGFHKADFAVKPWGGTSETDADWRLKMIDRLNRMPADPKSMPQNRSAWTEAEIDEMKKWLKENP